MPGPYSAAITFSLYTIPQRVVQHFRFGMADALDLFEIGDGGSLDGGDGLEVRQQRGARLFTDAGNGGQGGGVGLFSSLRACGSRWRSGGSRPECS